MKRIMVVAFFICLFSETAFAGGPGTTSANFLKAAQGVRPVSMGETYIALGNGLDTLYWNPAGLIQLDSPAAGFIHNFWFQDIGTEYLAYGSPLGILGAFGGGVTVLHAGTIDQTLEDAYGNYAGTGGQSSALSVALIGGYAQKLGRLVPLQDGFLKNVLVGASLRLVTESIADTNVFGGGLDVGAIWRQVEDLSPQGVTPADGHARAEKEQVKTRDQGLRLGFVAQNLGATTDSLMPMNFRAGAGYIFNDLISPFGRGTLAADILIPIDNSIRISLGGEYAHITENTEFAVRGGYKVGSEIKDLDSLAGLTAGAGFAINAGLIKYQLDYAFVPYGELGTTHRVSLTLAFLSPGNAVRPPISTGVVAPLPAAPVTAAVAGGARQAAPAATPAAAATPVPAATPAASAATAAAPAAASVTAAAAPEEAASRIAELNKSLERLQGRIRSGLLTGINFKRGETEPSDESKKVMNQIGRLLERYPEAALILSGFDADKKTAEEKAKAVGKYITMNFRVSPERIRAQSGDAAKQPKGTAIGFEATEAK